MNRAPTSLENKFLNLPAEVEKVLLKHTWIKQAQARLYEHGHLIFGEGFIKTLHNEPVSPNDLRKAMKTVRDLDWRLQGFSLIVYPKEENNDKKSKNDS